MAMTTTTDDREPLSRSVNEKLFVVVGRDVEDSKTTLSWALKNFGAHRDFCILHVHQPEQPEPPELAKQKMNEKLDECIYMCNRKEVAAKKIQTEKQDIGAGILELIDQHAVRKLVMGAAANCRYFEGMTHLKSRKAQFVNQHAHPSCEIWFICKGDLIHLREGKLDKSIADTTTSPLPASPVAQSGSVPSTGSVDSRSDSNEDAANRALVRYESVYKSGHSLESNPTPTRVAYAQHLPLSSPMGIDADKLIEELRKANTEAVNAKRVALEEFSRHLKAKEALIEANLRHDAAMAEIERERRKHGEELAKEKENCERLKALFFTVLGKNGELISEFPFSEIVEATGNFSHSSKLGEGEDGSTYKGFLRHTQVVIKMIRSDSSQRPSQFHQEVKLSRKFRHPNLVTLIGICAEEAQALVYENLPNGNLKDRLSCKDNTAPLSWQTRIRICIDTCATLIFLHSSHGMLHGDLKLENILLDANFMPKLRNFGLHPEHFHSTTNRELSVESDVYSFGIMLLRLLGGVASDLDEIMQNVLDDGDLDSVLDPTAGDWPLEQAKDLAQLARRCCHGIHPDLRSEVWPVLEAMQALCGEVSTSVHRGEPPLPSFMCPISGEIMVRPHVTADGHSYELEAIRRWLDSGHDTSPKTNLGLPDLRLIPNWTLLSAIQEWRDRCGNPV